MHLNVHLRPSHWKFVTSNGIGISFDVGVTGGSIVLLSPKKTKVNFYYGGAGAGLSAGIKLPKLGRLKKSGSGSSKDLPSRGKVYMLPAFQGAELKEADFQGGCVFVEGAAGLIGGVAGDIMFLNGNMGQFLLAMALAGANPVNAIDAVHKYLNSCKVLLFMGGVNVGVQASIGVTAYLGYLR